MSRPRSSSLLSRGEPLVWMTGAAMFLCLAMVTGLLGLLVWQGGRTFWPGSIERVETAETSYLGELADEEEYRVPDHLRTALSPEARATIAEAGGRAHRRLFRTGNFRLSGTHYTWLSDYEVRKSDRPDWAVCLERKEWGNFYGIPVAYLVDGRPVAQGAADAWAAFEKERAEGAASGCALLLRTADGKEATVATTDIVRGIASNRLGLWGRGEVYVSRWWEFLTANPREANTEGGVFPALLGTLVMTLLMAILVVPFGVLAALYLREYARQGALVSLVRIAVNNLAGVPSIVFGVFGLGFFCYVVGAGIDQSFFADRGHPTFGGGGLLWASLTLALLTLPVVVVATEEALSAVPHSLREGSYACGASKWQTIRRIVLPRAMPGVMTGMILAIARGAGEVAPLMLVGAVKFSQDLPLDTHFPFVHPERSFMHLGYHIYDLGFQSPNSQAARPMVFTTTLLLLGIILLLNIVAIRVRARLRRNYEGA